MKTKVRVFGPLLLIGLLEFSSCSIFTASGVEDSISAARTGAEANYRAGLAAQKEGKYPEALQYFEHVKTNYPYSTFAKMSDLQIAETHFSSEEWLDAALAYNFFLRFHPNDEDASYAAYRAALSFEKSAPTDIFFLPSPDTKDQTPTREALAAANSFSANYNDSNYRKEVSEIRDRAISRLIQHDVKIAQFYENRGKYRGSLWRYEKVLADFPQHKESSKILLAAAILAAKKLDDKEKALELLTKLAQQFPGQEEAKTGQVLMVELQSKNIKPLSSGAIEG